MIILRYLIKWSDYLNWRWNKTSMLKLKTFGKKVQGILVLILFSGLTISSCNSSNKGVLKNRLTSVLTELDSNLISLQNTDTTKSDHGGIWCSHCNLYHTRAAEAMFPFAYEYKLTKNPKFKEAAINLGNWLIRQQELDGSWKETPEDWTGTTTDQLLMIALAFQVLEADLSPIEKANWKKSMTAAGDYLTVTMSPEFASINYVATTTASLMVLNSVVSDIKYAEKAKFLAHQVVAKMDGDLFITGEGGRVFDAKYGVDLTYNMEMSLWGLALYAKLSGDELVLKKVVKSAENHLNFVFPDGSIDGSWGIRSNKWTCFGGATSDGTQVLFSLLSEFDNRYETASLKNLEYLKTCMKNGQVGYGPQHWEVMSDNPCIYPSFAKAKNCAMALNYLKEESSVYAELPSEANGLKVFPTLNIANIRTNNFCATITAYGYKDPKGAKSKYMYRPSGGAISNLWLKDYGFLQASSQTEYHRWEPMHFPEAAGLKSLTPRIEFSNEKGYFTNLFEFDATTNFYENENEIRANVYGELKNRDQEAGGIGYSYEYSFTDNSLAKKIQIRFHSLKDTIRIVEPIIQYKNVSIEQTGNNTVSIKTEKKSIEFEIKKGDVVLSIGDDAENYWSPYPALKAYPIILTIVPSNDEIEREITIRFKVVQY